MHLIASTLLWPWNSQGYLLPKQPSRTTDQRNTASPIVLGLPQMAAQWYLDALQSSWLALPGRQGSKASLVANTSTVIIDFLAPISQPSYHPILKTDLFDFPLIHAHTICICFDRTLSIHLCTYRHPTCNNTLLSIYILTSAFILNAAFVWKEKVSRNATQVVLRKWYCLLHAGISFLAYEAFA